MLLWFPAPCKTSRHSSYGSKLLTAQLQQLRAVEVQQRGQGWAICAVLEQVVHRGDPGDRLGWGLLLPVSRLRYTKCSYKVGCVTLLQVQCRLRRHGRVYVVVPQTQQQRCLCHPRWLIIHSYHLFKAALIVRNSQVGVAVVGVFSSNKNNYNKLPTWSTHNCFPKSPLLPWGQPLHLWTNYKSSQETQCMFALHFSK